MSRPTPDRAPTFPLLALDATRRSFLIGTGSLALGACSANPIGGSGPARAQSQAVSAETALSE